MGVNYGPFAVKNRMFDADVIPQAGRSTGNALGVLGLFFSSSESLIGWASDYALPDAGNSVLAGARRCVLRAYRRCNQAQPAACLPQRLLSTCVTTAALWDAICVA